MLNRKSVVLVLTQKCNLNCTYCYESNKNARNMSFETAKKIIDSEIKNIDGYDEVLFELFGGEPFMNFELIKSIVSYVRTIDCGITKGVFITTNGTLVHGEIKQWIEANLDLVHLALSYDGTDAMQDINRSNSSQLIDLDFFKKHFSKQVVKMTVSQNTLPDLYNGVVYLHKKGFKVACNLAYAVDWNDDRFSKILEEQLLKLIQYYLENPSIQPCELLNQTVMGAATMQTEYKCSCGAGSASFTYDVDGEKYPCQLFVPMSCGEQKAKNSQKIKFYCDLIPKEEYDSKCCDCVGNGVCNTCFGANYIASGNIYLHDTSWCTLQKITIRARAYFQAQLWEAGRLNLSEDEEMALLQSIKLINDQLIV
jgi:sulfatase maturation enzyme AslB (radical SAM superfamily)